MGVNEIKFVGYWDEKTFRRRQSKNTSGILRFHCKKINDGTETGLSISMPFYILLSQYKLYFFDKKNGLKLARG